MTIKADIWMPLYIDDWDGKTKHLDCEQDGAYGRLVRQYWRVGPLPDDDAQLARIVGMERARWRKHRSVIAAFFEIREGRWHHSRVDEEMERARAIIAKRREAGLKGGRPQKQMVSNSESKPKPNGSAEQKQNETPACVIVDVLATSQLEPTSEIPSQEEDSDSLGSHCPPNLIVLAGRSVG
jgi:uncharacterized protein YdaU (DUF1376 family)